MNSKGTNNYLISGVYTGVVIIAALLAQLLYVPEKISTDSIIKPEQVLIANETSGDSKDSSPSIYKVRQKRIDTVYIYNRKEPLIVIANPQSDSAGPSVADAKKVKKERRDTGKENDFVKEDIMEDFEQAFNNVIEHEKEINQKQVSENAEPENQSVDHGIMSEGMILDETQTRMGESFFSYFYNHWQPPSEASNFMITIKEKMMPSIGSSVSIMIDEELVFQTRLQPRFDYIEQMGQRAVAICYQRLQQTADSEYYQVY